MTYVLVNWSEDETSPGSGVPETPVSAANLAQMEQNLVDVAAGTGSAPKILEAAINTGAVTVTKIGALAVTAAKIGNGACTEGKIGSLACTEGKIGSLACVEGKIGPGSVTETKLGAGAVTNDKIKAAAISESKVAANAINADALKQTLADVLVSKYALGSIAFTDSWPQTANVTFPTGETPIISFRWRGKNEGPTPDEYSAWIYDTCQVEYQTDAGGGTFSHIASHCTLTTTYSSGTLTLTFTPIAWGILAVAGAASAALVDFSGVNKTSFWLPNESGTYEQTYDSVEVEYSVTGIGLL